jgi:hypothetical protein
MGAGSRVTGGNRRKVQVRKAPRGSFGERERQVFLDHLAACCNVTAAAAAAGVGVSTVYDARRRDPAFAQAWDEAIEAGYATLEALLLERAAVGAAYVPGATKVPGPETIDTWLALDLLRLSRAPKRTPKASGRPPRRADEKALAEAICAKLDVLEKRRARKEKGRLTGPERADAGRKKAA